MGEGFSKQVKRIALYRTLVDSSCAKVIIIVQLQVLEALVAEY